MKKVLVAVGVLVALCLVAILVIPLVYNVNQNVRPKIVAAIEENTNAKAEIGHMGLSLWGGVFITVESLKLTDPADGTAVFEMQNAKLNIPLSSILGGRLEVTVIAESPQIHLIKDKQGKLNALKLIKPAAQKQADAQASGKSESAPPSSAAGVAGRFSLSTRITEAKLDYLDQQTGSKSSIDKLGLMIDDVSVNRPIKMRVTANLSVTQGKNIALNGPMSFTGTTLISLKPEGLEKVDFDAIIDLDELNIRFADLFKKDPKVPLKIETKLTATPNSANIEKLDLVVNNFKVNTTITVENFDAPVFDVKVKSNDFQFASWKNIISPIKDFDMEGSAVLNFGFKGTAEKFTYNGNVDLKNTSLRAPGVAPRVEGVNAGLVLDNDMLKLNNASMKMGSSDLTVTGVVQNFKAPNVRVNVQSKMLNVDELIGAKPEEKPAPTTAPQKEVSSEERDKQIESMAKGPLDAIKKNPIMRSLVFNATAKIQKMIVHKAPLIDFTADMSFERLVMNLKEAKLKAFGGGADAKLSVDFNGVDPAYKLGANVKGVDIDEAVTNQMPDLKGFITGKAQANLDIAGTGVTVAKAKQALIGAGKFAIINGTWSGLTPMKMIAEKLKSVPQVKDKLGGVVVGNKFKTFAGQFDIKNGHINITNTAMELEEAKTGLTIAGWIDFDKKIAMTGSLLAPIADAPKKLVGPDGRARIPFEVNGAMMSPQPNYEATLKPVAAAYLEQEGKKALGQAAQKGVEELKKNIKNEKVKEMIKDEKVKDLLKGIGL